MTNTQRIDALTRIERAMVVGGVVAPIILATVVIVLGSQQPRFNHLENAISILGSSRTGAHPDVMNWIGFVVTGLLLAGFSAQLLRRAPSLSGKTAALFTFCGAAGLVAAGLIPLPNRIHHLMTGLTLLGFVGGVIGLRRDLAKITGQQWLTSFSILSGLLSLACVGLLWVLPQWAGLLQRLSLGSAMIWVEIVAVAILKVPRSAIEPALARTIHERSPNARRGQIPAAK